MDQNQNQFENVYQNSATPTVKNASYFRTRAREALKEKWGDAILIGFLFSLLCGGVVGGFSGVSSNFSVNIDLGGGFSGMLPSALLGIFAAIAGYAVPQEISVLQWLETYKQQWRKESKESELHVIENLFLFAEKNAIHKTKESNYEP